MTALKCNCSKKEITMNTKKHLLMTAALAGLTLTSCATDSSSHQNSQMGSDQVMCYGVNSCKGHGDCAGKVDACNGKNGCEEKISCKGHNSCKGKGLKKMSKKECLSKKGKVAS